MASREELIEEAAKAIYENERKNIEGGQDWPTWENSRPRSRESVLDAARAAFAVFEKAQSIKDAEFQSNDDEIWRAGYFDGYESASGDRDD